jgi:hypothetical protein
MPIIEEEPITRETQATSYDRTQREAAPPPIPSGPGPAKFLAGGSVLEAVAGLVALILAIIGLSGTLPTWMATIATVIVGIAFLVGGATFAAHFSGATMGRPVGFRLLAELRGGMLVVFLGGLAGVILGILSIIGLIPAVLLDLAAIILGATLILTGGPIVRFSRQMIEGTAGTTPLSGVAREAVWVVAALQVMIGLGSIVLGIVGLAGYFPITLSLVAMLVLGFSTFMLGIAVSDRMFRSLDRGSPRA